MSSHERSLNINSNIHLLKYSFILPSFNSHFRDCVYDRYMLYGDITGNNIDIAFALPTDRKVQPSNPCRSCGFVQNVQGETRFIVNINVAFLQDSNSNPPT